jgi:uncharacterized membrane protein YeaQ/YmgE (transglycosylase-associated protein family)
MGIYLLYGNKSRLEGRRGWGERSSPSVRRTRWDRRPGNHFGGIHVKHYLAFVVIGLVIGWRVGRNSRIIPLPIVLGLIGAFAGGEILIAHRYISILGAIVGAVVLSFVGTALTRK